MIFYEYLLIILTVLVVYEIIFSILIRPYYVRKILDEDLKNVTFPEVSFEAFLLLTVVLGLSLGTALKVHPYIFFGPIFLIYGLASLSPKFSFYLASALLFNVYRDLPYSKQMARQKIFITYLFFIFAVAFFSVSLTLK